MESLLNLPLAGGTRGRILQITDTHLFAQKHETLLGVNTWESYQAVLAAIRNSQREFDLIVATGDLAQDHSAEAYQHFAEGIAGFPAIPPVRMYNGSSLPMPLEFHGVVSRTAETAGRAWRAPA